ncbi:MAG TPA: endonuclease/exonuclease/phosphatase family protein [Solirubrobacteraceae bacterium]|nr:endonuclease/exonuclease/phosphatase family protein [Solirubrobacteraceae bacterium]
MGSVNTKGVMPTGVLTKSRSRRAAALLASLATVAIALAALNANVTRADQRSVTVMTQNLYQGTEFRHIQALAGANPTLEEALAATTADYGTYLATRFPDRAQQIAAEILSNRPALVGLQEVATWHAGAFDSQHPFALPAPVSEDFTQVLVAALAADGAHYAAVSRHDDNFTLAFPVLTPSGLAAVGMVESGVILARTDLPPGQLKLSNPQSGTFNARLPLIPNPLDPDPPHGFQFTNSWQSIDAKLRGKSFRFITTHLDALAPGGVVSGPQAHELLAGPADTSLPVILSGDMNSGLTSSPAAYEAFVAGGLSDTWTAAGLGAPPLTCCHLAPNDLVSDPTAPYTQDLDHIFTRGDLTVTNEHLVGNLAPSNPPPSFIWPSDHAGMVATLKIGPHG